MPTATITFNLMDPDDAHAHEVMLAAPKILSTLRAYDEVLRRTIRDSALNGVQLPDGAVDVFVRARSLLHEEVQDHEIAHLMHR